MKKKVRNILLGFLTCGLLSIATTLGVTLGVSPAKADSARVKPTGTNTELLTQEINDDDLDTFKVVGASTGKKELLGFRFLATIENSDLALLPNTAEFGMLLIPNKKLGDAELTKDTNGAFVAPALVDTVSDDVPVNGMGYYITLMGETLETAFPVNLYGTAIAARAYVKYTYEVDGKTITDYIYSKDTVNRSIAYVASRELVTLENNGEADKDADSHLNTIITETTLRARLQFSLDKIEQGDVAEVSLSNATDGVNNYAYNLSSSDESVAIIENGKVKAVGKGTTIITATLGAKTVSKEITIEGKAPVLFEGGDILYSTQDGTIFMPNGLLDADETIVSAIGRFDGVDYFDKGSWNALALNATEIQTNAIGKKVLTVGTSDGDVYYVNAYSYAGVIDELSDFPKFFNNDASASVAPNVYGYYIVTKDLGTGSEELAFTQTEKTDYSATNGFNGVLDGAGHTLKFKLKSGGLVGMILGNAAITNMRIIFEDATSTHYGVFGYMTNGAPEIRNCYIEQTNNHYQRTTLWGIMARPNGKLRLHNTVVFGGNIGFDSTWSTPNMNATSSNAYVIHANAGATSFAISKNFTKVINDGLQNGARELALSEIADASGFNAYWSQENGVLTWKGAEGDMASVYDKKYVEIVKEKAYYSTVNSEMILPEGLFADGETIVDARDENGTDYYENGKWNNLAVNTSANDTKNTTLIIETSKGYFYQVTVGSYAGVIDELSDFTTFFNNDTSAIAPNLYGYYVVTKDLGTGSETLALTQTTQTNYASTNGFNGVLDGQGYTLRFKLTSGGLVGMILGNAVIKNLGIIFEDATSTGYGIFGYVTNGAPEIRNCYIEQTNNHFKRTTVYGLMARCNGKLRLHNTVVYGYNISMDNTTWSTVNLNDNSSNAYVIHARSGANSFAISKNFTKVFNDGLENGSRHVLLSEIADARGFDSNYWHKKDGKLIWKGLDLVNVSWVNGLTKTKEIYTQGSVVQFSTLTEAYWSTEEKGDKIANLSGIRAQEDCTYYAVYADVKISENALYSTLTNEFFLPDSMGLDMSDIAYIMNEDGTLIYYEDEEWDNEFALTDEQIQANETIETSIIISDGKRDYLVKVTSYAGIIDELSDFPKFFNNEATEAGIAPTTYGHYAIIKNIGSLTDDLAMTQCSETNYSANCGFSGVVDGLGHTVQFNLTSGALFGMILGNCTIQNLAVVYNDNTAGDFGAFGFLTHGAPQIINCYIAKQNNRYLKATTYGIMARPNGKLVLENTVVFGSNVTMDNGLYASTATISAASKNAFVIYGRATNTTINTNFTQVSTNGAITDASSVLDSTYWTTTDNKPVWNGLGNTTVTTAGEIEVVQRYLAENGTTKYAIVLPDDADDTLIFAKDELIAFFEEATGATLTVELDAAYNKNYTYISIGNTEAFAVSGIELGDVNDQGYCINTKKNMIYINANTSLGCLYGVYGLLNELFDYEQFSVDCYTLNGASTVKVPNLNVVENPSFEMRYPVSGTVRANDAYAMRLKMADTIYILPAGDIKNNGGAGWRENHNVLEILPPDYWKAQGKTNWFSDDGEQLCYTAHGNSADYAAMVAQIVDAMTLTLGSDTFLGAAYANAKYIAISGEDGDGYCTCSACKTAKATYGSDAGAAIKLCNDVREGLETWMNDNPKYKRDLTLLFLAYNRYFDAPVVKNQTTGKYELKGGLTLRSDVGIWVAGSSYVQYYYDIDHANNADFKEAFQKWVDVTDASGSDLCVWTYSLNNNEYMLHTDMYGDNTFFNEKAYQYFESKGVDMYYNQGPWDATETVTAFNRLNIYLDSQLQWDSTQSVTELTNKFFNAMYGAGASYMKQLYDAENAASRELFDPDIVGVPNDQTNSFERWWGVLSSSNINKWLGYITSAKNAVNADATLDEDQKAAYINRINDEWIAVKYWQMRYHGSSIKAAAKAEFREVLGYDESTGEYAKDVKIGERYDYTLTAWIENNFEAP